MNNKILLAAALLFALPAAPARGGTVITVNSRDDAIVVDGNCSLREAVQAANSDAPVDQCPSGNGTDTILLPEGVFSVSDATTNTVKLGVVLASDMTITSAGRDRTIIDPVRANGDFSAFTVAANASVTLSDLRIQTSADNFGTGRGVLNAGTLSLVRVRLLGLSTPYGAGVYNDLGSVLSISDSDLGNLKSYSGSAVYARGSEIVIHNSQIHDSSGDYAIDHNFSFIDEPVTLTASSTAFIRLSRGAIHSIGMTRLQDISVENVTPEAAAIEVRGQLNVRNAQITSSDSRGRHVKGGLGSPPECAALRVYGSSTIERLVIRNNSAVGSYFGYLNGRGIIGGVCFTYGTHTLSSSAIISNLADYGGGIGVSGGAVLTITNSTIANNVSLSSTMASAIAIEAGSSVVIQHSSIVSNSAPALGSSDGSTVTLQNAIVSGTAPNCVFPIASLGNNLGTDSSCNLTALTDIITTSVGLGPIPVGVDGPGFVALLPGSPAIDAGQTITDDVARTDQRGYARAFGGPRTDIGAYELIDFKKLNSVWLPVLSR